MDNKNTEKKNNRNTKRPAIEKGLIYVGKKPVMSYVLAAVSQLANGQENIRIKALGKSISTAVDVAEILRNRYLKSAKIKSITIGTERMKPTKIENARELNVSAIEITISK